MAKSVKLAITYHFLWLNKNCEIWQPLNMNYNVNYNNIVHLTNTKEYGSSSPLPSSPYVPSVMPVFF